MRFTIPHSLNRDVAQDKLETAMPEIIRDLTSRHKVSNLVTTWDGSVFNFTFRTKKFLVTFSVSGIVHILDNGILVDIVIPLRDNDTEIEVALTALIRGALDA
jgi:hypothetical protein